MVWRLDLTSVTSKDTSKRIQLYNFPDGHVPPFVPMTFEFLNLAGTTRPIQLQVPPAGPTIEWMPDRLGGKEAVAMTDGCSLISASAMSKSSELFAKGEDGSGKGLDLMTPGAVQARILNAKGSCHSLLQSRLD